MSTKGYHLNKLDRAGATNAANNNFQMFLPFMGVAAILVM